MFLTVLFYVLKVIMCLYVYDKEVVFTMCERITIKKTNKLIPSSIPIP